MWVVLNTIYMLLGILLTHRHFLKGEAWRWLGEDVGLPLLATVLVAGLGRWVVTSPMVPIWALPGLSTILICSFAAAALISTQTRSWVLAKLVKAKSSYA